MFFSSPAKMSLVLTLSLSLLACATPNTQTAGNVGAFSPNQSNVQSLATSASDSGAYTAQITGTSSLKGRIVLPYVVQPTQVASASFSVMGLFTGLPAHAQEASEASDDANSVTTEDLENLQATVNGEEVEITVVSVETNEETEETVINYEIEEAPATEGQEVLEIETESGDPLLGAITDVEADTTTEQDVTTETTSLLETATEIHGRFKISDLTEADLTALAINPETLNKNASLRSILKKDGTLKANKAKKLALSPCAEASENEESEDDFTTQSSDKGNGKAKGQAKKAEAQSKKSASSSASDSTESDGDGDDSASTSPCASPEPSAEPTTEPAAEPTAEPTTEPTTEPTEETESTEETEKSTETTTEETTDDTPDESATESETSEETSTTETP